MEMEIVVLRSDIARLVLDYLKHEQLESSARIFCKTSPHLRQEFSAYKQGLQAYSFFPDLEEIICEYVKITRKVEQLSLGLSDTCRAQLQHRKLSDKVIELLERAVQAVSSSIVSGTECKANSSAGIRSINSDKENNAKGRRSGLQQKRKNDSLAYSADEQKKPAYTVQRNKRRRVLEPFCYLSAKCKQRKSEARLTSCYSSGEETTHSDDNYDDDDDGEIGAEEASSEAEHDVDPVDISLIDKPTKESTPRTPAVAQHCTPPSLPEISQAILDNPEFQLKLVQNINQALLTNNTIGNLPVNATLANSSIEATNAGVQVEALPNETKLNEEQQIISSNQLLDQMVKNILEATEKDPTFDAIIEEVIGASNKSLVTAAIQCNMEDAAGGAVFPRSGTTEVRNIAASVPPTTPLIIRTAVEAAANSASVEHNATLPINTSFGSLIDPNFSISKLIVLNSNDSAQKQPPEQSIGNTTADQLITQLASANVDCPVDDQVYFDPTTGQLTFPLFLTNDGLLTNFPFLINNEVVTQQLLPSNMANLESSRIEIPLPQPIIVSADQLPPNSIILSSAQKVDTDEVQKLPPNTLLKTAKGASTVICSAVPTSLDSRVHIERATPSGSGIVNAKAYRSLSTPRKRASHVRTLTFSPRSLVGPITLTSGTPLSTRKETLSRLKRMSKTKPESAKKPEALVSEKPIIKNVEVLPRITTATGETSCNESSNSCSVPPLFAAGEESSNVTVIKGGCYGKEVPKPKMKCVETKVLGANADTPKRKQPRRTAVRACKRQLSKSSNEEEEFEEVSQAQEEKNAKESSQVASKENQSSGASCLQREQSTLVDHNKGEKDKLLEEWQRMRSATCNDLDTRLRELNAKMVQSRPKKKEIKKKVRRKKAINSKKKKQGESNASITENELDAEAVNQFGDETDTTATTGTSKTKTKIKKDRAASTKEKMHQLKEKRLKTNEKPREFNVKILTPQKYANEKQKEKREELKEREDKQETEFKLVENNKMAVTVKQPTVAVKQDEVAWVLESTTAQIFQKPTQQPPPHHPFAQDQAPQVVPPEAIEREKRTANIACLLDTPFKDVNTSSMIPPTPGLFAPSLDTPLSKIRPSEHDAINSTSFLFGSLTKSELDTPMLSAITPGFRFTPFDSRDATPRSMTATEYSSGGSYYRPDESDDLDKNIDRLLRNSVQNKQQDESPEVQQFDCKDVKHPQMEGVDATALPTVVAIDAEAVKGICVEIPVEKLKVEPIVLKRVKSFGNEAPESAEKAAPKIDPHYTLISGLPDISAEEVESSSSSSSSSSSLSSSNVSTSSSDDNSSATSSAAAGSSPTSKSIIQRTECKTPEKVLASLSLDNLSEISSTEDEEWQRLVVTEGEQSQLVSNDGEVRYPVRSWLTPSKQQAPQAVKMATIKVTLPLKSAEKRQQRKRATELEQKRERMKEKLRLDSQHKATSPTTATIAPCISAALANTRKIKAMLDKPKRLTAAPSPRQIEASPEEKRTIDVLTALNLSAKKQPSGVTINTAIERTSAITTPPKPTGTPPAMPSPGDIDDNAVSNIFVDAPTPASKMHTNNAASKALLSTSKIGRRKCLQIEARPAPTQSRSNAKKKLVHTPLDFKGPAATTALEIIDIAAPAPTAAKVSPIPKIKITPSIGAAVGSTLRVSPRLSKIQKVTKKAPAVASKRLKSPLTIKPRVGKDNKKQVPMQLAKAAAATASAQQRLHTDTMTATKSGKKSQIKVNNKGKVLAKAKPKGQERKKVVSRASSNCVAATVVKGATVEKTLILPIVAAVPKPIETADKQPIALIDSSEDDDYEEEEDNFELVSITSADAKRFINLRYEGLADEPKEPLPNHDFSTFKMVVAIDENERHTWQITDEVCLYTSAPQSVANSAASTTTQSIRNIPKKRKIRITTSSISEEAAPIAASTTPAAVTAAATVAAAPLEVNDQSVANSTPLAGTSDTCATMAKSQALLPRRTKPNTQRNKVSSTKALAEIFPITNSASGTHSNVLTAKSTLQIWSSEAISTTETTTKTTTATTNANANAAEKIQIEDIESILSHLHGT